MGEGKEDGGEGKVDGGEGRGDQRWVLAIWTSPGESDAPAEAALPRKASSKATVSLSAGVTQVRVAAVPVAPGSVSPSPPRCRAVTGAVPAEPQHSRGTGIYLLRQLCNRFLGGADCKLQS